MLLWKCCHSSIRAVAVCIAAVLLFAATTIVATTPRTEAQLSSALEVRSLSAEKAESGQSVDITAVVTFADPPATVFVQDKTAGTFFRLEKAVSPRPGDLVRIRGTTFPGLYLPGIENARFEILSHQGLPEPVAANFDDLISGRYHYQRVSVEGIIRSVTPEEEGASLARLALGSRVIDVRVEKPLPSQMNFIDSRVLVTGLAAGRINDRRQLVAPYLRCADWTDWQTLIPSPKTKEVPSVSPEELLTFNVKGRAEHRVRLSGTLVASFPGRELFLRHGESAIGVHLLSPYPGLQPGDKIEVIGFPEMDRFRATLVDARILSLEPGDEVPNPVPLSLAEIFSGTFDSDLVTLSGTVSDWYRIDRGTVVTLREGNRTLPVHLPELPSGIAIGAFAEVSGICRVEATREAEYRSHADRVSLQVRDVDDFVVLRAPGWWTPQRLATTLILLAFAILLAGLWIALLRRQVSQQTRSIRQGIQNEAILEERQRIAREFHDTLEQDLAGLTLRLDAATARGSDGNQRKLLEGSRHLVTRIQTETRNLVSDLRDAHGEHSQLEEALDHLREEIPSETAPEVEWKLEPLPPLPSRTTHHLKMITREAITNAQKHAQADLISVKADQKDGVVVLSISDDGKGIDQESDTHGTPGHFGCMGIRERARRIGAEPHWQSLPDKGTTLTIRLPLES